MGELLIQFLTGNEADAAVLRAETSRKALLADVAGEEKRIANVPGDYSVRNSLGVHYVQLGRNDDARAQFLAALELSPITPSRTTTSGSSRFWVTARRKPSRT